MVTSSSNGRKAHIYRPKGRLSLPPRGEPRDVTANVRCPCEVREIKTLTKAGPIKASIRPLGPT
jgi:hypothetical protein